MELVAGKGQVELGLCSWVEVNGDNLGWGTSVAWVGHRKCSAARKWDEEMH